MNGVIDTDGIANPITIYINIIQNHIVIMCTNGFDQFSATFWNCTHKDPFEWLIDHLIIMEETADPNHLKNQCIAPNECCKCQKSFNIIAQKLKAWMGGDYSEFLRDPVIISIPISSIQ